MSAHDERFDQASPAYHHWRSYRCGVCRARTHAAQNAAGKPLSAPTVISNPPRDFGPDAPPTTYFTDPDVLTVDPAFNALIQANTSIKRLWTGALLGRRAGMEQSGHGICCGATSPTTASCAGWKTMVTSPCSEPFQQQQWQHLRRPGSPVVLRTPDAPGRPLRARRIDHGHRGFVQGQAAELTERRCGPHATAASGLPIRPTAGSCMKARPTRAAARPILGPSESASGATGGSGAQAGAADECLPRRSGRTHRHRHHGGSGAGPERHHVLAGLQEAVRREHRQRTGRYRRRR